MKLFLLFYASLIIYCLGSWTAKGDTKCDADCIRDSRIIAQWTAELEERIRKRRESRCADGRVLAAIDGKLWCIRLKFGVR